MNDEAAFRDKLRKIEALFSGASTPARKPPLALRRMASAPGCGKRRSARSRSRCASVCPIHGGATYFIALWRRYGLRPYRYPRMRQQCVMLRAPQRFLDKVLWPEFKEINAALTEYLAQVTDRVIREAATRTAEMPKRWRNRRSSGDSTERLGRADAPWPADLMRLGSRYEPLADHLRCGVDRCWAALPLLQKLGLGRLPGDIVIERESFRFYFPIVTSLIISVLLSRSCGY